MPYLEHLFKVPDGYHAARWHASGKLWLSQDSYSNIDELKETIKIANDRLDSRAVGMVSRYFVWHAGMSKDDLEAYRPVS
jgi:hypothetical protein